MQSLKNPLARLARKTTFHSKTPKPPIFHILYLTNLKISISFNNKINL